MILLYLTIVCVQLINFGKSIDIDKDQLEKVLIQDYQRNSIKEVLTVLKTAAEENVTTLGSEDSRLTMDVLLGDGTITKKSVILKAIPSSPALNKQIADSGLFNTEIEVYRDALPKMEKQLRKMNDKSEPLWVRALGFREYDQLILEDVEKQLDYRIVHRLQGLDLDHTLLALSAMAKFHALSAVTDQANEHKIKEQFSQSLLERNYDELRDFFEAIYKGFANTIDEHWGPEWVSAAEKIRKIAPDVKRKLLDIYSAKYSFINVLNIGAPTIRRTYFKYSITDLTSSLKPLAVRFSYFQLSFFNSPLLDVQYFINTSPKLEVMIRNRTVLLETYFDTFVDYLKVFNYQGRLPTRQEFDNEVNRTNFHGLTTAIQILPVIFEPTRSSPAQDAERLAENNRDSNTTVIDSQGMVTKKYEHYMKSLLNEAFHNRVL